MLPEWPMRMNVIAWFCALAFDIVFFYRHIAALRFYAFCGLALPTQLACGRV